MLPQLTILQSLDEPSALPPPRAGWAMRRMSTHFAAHDQVVAGEFVRLVDIDLRRIDRCFPACEAVSCHERQGEECLAANELEPTAPMEEQSSCA